MPIVKIDNMTDPFATKVLCCRRGGAIPHAAIKFSWPCHAVNSCWGDAAAALLLCAPNLQTVGIMPLLLLPS